MASHTACAMNIPTWRNKASHCRRRTYANLGFQNRCVLEMITPGLFSRTADTGELGLLTSGDSLAAETGLVPPAAPAATAFLVTRARLVRNRKAWRNATTSTIFSRSGARSIHHRQHDIPQSERHCVGLIHIEQRHRHRALQHG